MRPTHKNVAGLATIGTINNFCNFLWHHQRNWNSFDLLCKRLPTLFAEEDPPARKNLKFQSFIIFKKEKETELWGWQTCPTYIYVPVTRASSPLFDYIHSTCQPFVLNKHFAVWWFILLFKNNRMMMKIISPVRIRSLSLLWKRLLIVGRLWREM